MMTLGQKWKPALGGADKTASVLERAPPGNRRVTPEVMYMLGKIRPFEQLSDRGRRDLLSRAEAPG